MGAFNFRLQKVLDLRSHREKEVATRLGEARERMREAELALEHLREIRAATHRQISQSHGSGGTVGQLRNLGFVLSQIDSQIAEADSRRRTAEDGVRDSLADYATAFRDRRILEQLREREIESSRAADLLTERKLMDELAAVRHGRPIQQADEAEGRE